MNEENINELEQVTDVSTAVAPLGIVNTERRTGKVARLTKAQRDKINQMIQDGVTYLEIIRSLGPEGEHITEQNLSTWKSGGYVDWLREMQLASAIERKHELAQSIVSRSSDVTGAGQALLTVIATNLLEFLTETDPVTMRDSLLSDSDKFTRFVNAMVRLAEGGVKCQLQRYREADRAAEAAKATRTQRRGVTEESLREAEAKLNLM
jgi:hypothetical protein